MLSRTKAVKQKSWDTNYLHCKHALLVRNRLSYCQQERYGTCAGVNQEPELGRVFAVQA
jgi:hypothetical protein